MNPVELLVDGVVELVTGVVPSAVWGVLLFLVGAALVIAGVLALGTSPVTGGVFIAIGAVAAGGVLVTWKR